MVSYFGFIPWFLHELSLWIHEFHTLVSYPLTNHGCIPWFHGLFHTLFHALVSCRGFVGVRWFHTSFIPWRGDFGRFGEKGWCSALVGFRLCLSTPVQGPASSLVSSLVSYLFQFASFIPGFIPVLYPVKKRTASGP